MLATIFLDVTSKHSNETNFFDIKIDSGGWFIDCGKQSPSKYEMPLRITE